MQDAEQIVIREVFVLKSIRVFFTKTDRMRFVSHLDMNRFMIRILYKSGLPIWFTEGFNPHPYLTFALPLSLGFESEYEIMDIRVNDDNLSCEEIKEKLTSVCPPYINIFKVAEPILKSGKVAFASFKITFDTKTKEFYKALGEFLSRDSVICSKTTKKGKIKEIDIIPKIVSWEISDDTLQLTLPAGSEDNLNPTLILDAFFEEGKTDYYCYDIIRTKIMDNNMNLFV